MQPRTFVLTALAAVVTTVVALVVNAASNHFSQPPTSGARVVPALASASARIGSVVISKGETTLTLEAKGEKGDQWTIKERGGYPADPDRVRALLVKLSQAELVEAKTRVADKLSLLELEDVRKDAPSRGLKILDPKGAVLADLIIGKKRFEAFGSGRTGTYVRKAKDPQAWLASLDLDPSTDLTAWAKTSVIEMESSKVDSVRFEVAGEEPLEIKRTDGKAAFVGFPPEGRKAKELPDTLIRTAGLIDLEDVRKLAATPSGDGVSVVTLRGATGLQVTLRVRKDGEHHWLSVAASGEGEGKAAADALSARTSGWEFRIPASKAEQLLRKRADLLEPEKSG